MSEPTPDDDPWPRIVRAAAPGRPRTRPPAEAPGTSSVWQPGRAAIEWSILCCAAGLLFPVLAVAGAGFALRARHLGSPRWLAALLCAVWCAVLGGTLRVGLNFSLVP